MRVSPTPRALTALPDDSVLLSTSFVLTPSSQAVKLGFSAPLRVHQFA